MGKVLYSVRLNSDILGKLKMVAEKENLSVSDIVRRKLKSIDLMEIENE